MGWTASISAWWIAWRRPKPLGYLGERQAERFLRREGYKIVARALRLRGGELDLVAVNCRTLVFVEVKTRRTHQFGKPAEAIDIKKQRRLTRGALSYLKRHGLLECRCRFDVVAVTWPHHSKKPTIEHIMNAFEAVGSEGLFS
jgi:putative endonuclease